MDPRPHVLDRNRTVPPSSSRAERFTAAHRTEPYPALLLSRASDPVPWESGRLQPSGSCPDGWVRPPVFSFFPAEEGKSHYQKCLGAHLPSSQIGTAVCVTAPSSQAISPRRPKAAVLEHSAKSPLPCLWNTRCAPWALIGGVRSWLGHGVDSCAMFTGLGKPELSLHEDG